MSAPRLEFKGVFPAPPTPVAEDGMVHEKALRALLLDDEQGVRIREIPVRIAHGARRRRDRLLELEVGDIPVLFVENHLLAHGVDAEVPQQRLARNLRRGSSWSSACCPSRRCRCRPMASVA